MSEAVRIKIESLEGRVLGIEDIPECVKVISENFHIQRASVEQWFERRIVANPWQERLPGVGVGLTHKGRLIACRAMLAQPWWLNGKSNVLAFGANTAVEAEYRGQGLATRLIRLSTDFAPITGSATAGNVTQSIYRKLGFVAVGGSDSDFFRSRVSFRGSLEKRLGRPLGTYLGNFMDRVASVTRMSFPNAKGAFLETHSQCGSEFDDFWAKAKYGYVSCLERTSGYLNWRVFDYPTYPLTLESLRDASGALLGYAIWATQSFGDAVKMAVLRDVFYQINNPESLMSLLRLLMMKWQQNGISWASFEVASPAITPVFRSLGFQAVPSRGNRYQLKSDGDLGEEVYMNWLRSGIDGDYFDLPQ